MKRLLILMISTLLLVSCSAGTSNLKEKNEVLFEIGSEKITTNQVYTMLRHQETGVEIINIAKQILLDEAAPITDEMKTNAEETYDEYEELYGSFMSYVTGGLSKEEFIEKQLIPFEQEKHYLEPHFNEEYDNIFEEDPAVRVYYLRFDTIDTAKLVIEDLQAGKTWEEIKEDHLDEDDTQSIESKLLQTTTTTVPTQLLQWAMKTDVVDGDIHPDYFTDSTNENYIVAQIDTKDQALLKEDYFYSWLNDTDRIGEIYAEAFKKANFRVYDALFYDQIKADEDYQNFLP